MGLTETFYKVATGGWMLFVIGAWAAGDQDYTEPWFSFSAVPGGLVGGMAVALGAILVGAGVIGAVQQRHESGEWQEWGRQADLQPSDDETIPELTGTIDGRTVTARYEGRRQGGGQEDEVRQVPFTSADADLASPADEGVVVGTDGVELDVESGVGTLDFDDMAETAADVEGLVAGESGDLILVGTSSSVMEALTEGLPGRALRAIGELQIVSAGDASGVVARWAEARNEELEGSNIEYPVENLVERVPGDAGTVTVETQAAMGDGDELRRFTEGVVAIADASKESTARTPVSG
jgi:hypothetical protein